MPPGQYWQQLAGDGTDSLCAPGIRTALPLGGLEALAQGSSLDPPCSQRGQQKGGRAKN